MKTEHEVLVAVIENLTKLRQQTLIPTVSRNLGICRYAIDGLRPLEQSVASVLLKAEFARMGLNPGAPCRESVFGLVEKSEVAVAL